jgi:hypothetical protein
MKRGTPDHPKVLELSELLGVRRPTAIGHLELLFHFTAQYAPEGNIGKYSNRRIAAALDWGGKTDASVDKCIDAFVDSGWIDRCEINRLVTHDWAAHMDKATRQRLRNSGRDPVAPPPRHPRATLATPPRYPRDTLATPLRHPRDTLATPSDLPRTSVFSKNTIEQNHTDSGKSWTPYEPSAPPQPSTTTTTTTTTSTSTATELECEHTDLSFSEFVAACTERRIFEVGDTAWRRAAGAWKHLSFEQKIAAVQDVRKRDPDAVEIRSPALPANYLADHKFERPHAPSNGDRAARQKLESSPSVIAARMFMGGGSK